MSEFIKARIGALDGRAQAYRIGTGPNRNAVTDRDIAFALSATTFRHPMIPKLLSWCYQESGIKYGMDLFEWLERRGDDFLKERPPTDEWPSSLYHKVIGAVMEELRWGFSKRLTDERIARPHNGIPEGLFDDLGNG